jgi:hypothetical protein
LALHESDVGIVDWNKHYIGVPLAGSLTTAPAFLHVGNETVVLTATGSNVLAALGKVPILFILECGIGLGIHMSHGSVGRINWRYVSFSIMVFCSFRLSY